MCNRISSILLAVLIICPVSSSSMPLNVDLVIMIHDWAQRYEKECDHIKATLRKEIPIVFDIHENKTRVALLANIGGTTPPGLNREYRPACDGNVLGKWHPYTHLTGDQGTFERAVDEIRTMCTTSNLLESLEMVQKMFRGIPVTRPRVLLIISMYYTKLTGSDAEKAENLRRQKETAEELRSDVLIFAVYYFEHLESVAYVPALTAQEQLKDIVGDPSNLYYLNHTFKFETTFDYNWLVRFKKDVEKQLCQFKDICHYGEEGACYKSSYTPYVDQRMTYFGNNCMDYPPTIREPELCPFEKCEKDCDHFGTVDKPEVDCTHRNNCGKAYVLNRTRPIRWEWQNNCTVGTFQCSPCPLKLPRLLDRPEEPSTDTMPIVVSLVIVFILLLATCGFIYLIYGDKWKAKMRKRRQKDRKESKKQSKSKPKTKAKSKNKKTSKSKKKKSMSKKKQRPGKEEEEEENEEEEEEGEEDVEKAKPKAACKISKKKKGRK